MRSQIRYRNGNGLILTLGSLDREKATFPACVFCAGLCRYQTRSRKGEGHFIPDRILPLKDGSVLAIKTVEDLLFDRLLEEKEVAIAQVTFGLSSHISVHVKLGNDVGEGVYEFWDKLFYIFRCLPALLGRCGQIRLLDELKNGLSQRRRVQRYLGSRVLVPQGEDHGTCRHFVKLLSEVCKRGQYVGGRDIVRPPFSRIA